MTTTEIANIVRLWAVENHLIPPTRRGTSQQILSPPLFSAPKQLTAPTLSFSWFVPQSGLPEVTDVKLNNPNETGRVNEKSNDPEQLLAFLLKVAAFRANSAQRSAVTTDYATAAHDAAMQLISLATQQTQAAASTIKDGFVTGHPPDLWVASPSFFFPTLFGIDKNLPQSKPGMLWLNTAGFGAQPPTTPQLSLADFDYPDRVTRNKDLEGFSVRDVDISTDAAYLSHWMNLPHLAVTFRQAWSTQRWEEELQLLSNQAFTRPCILSLNDTPLGYLELYRPAAMNIGAARPTDPRTVGIHIAIADPRQIGTGVGRQLVTLFGHSIMAGDPHYFSHGLGEPDLLNTAARGAAQHTLGQEIAELAFPNKCAALISSAPTLTALRDHHV